MTENDNLRNNSIFLSVIAGVTDSDSDKILSLSNEKDILFSRFI